MNESPYTWKGSLINSIINVNDFNSYLELGLGNGDTWNIVECSRKVGVDNNQDIANRLSGVCSTTDEYLENCTETFDLIYIDALHEKSQVLKDFRNSLKILNERGIIVFHDINPLNESQVSSSASGDVFELWMELVEKYRKHVKVVIGVGGDTVGIFYKEGFVESLPYSTMNRGYGYFNENRNRYIEELV